MQNTTRFSPIQPFAVFQHAFLNTFPGFLLDFLGGHVPHSAVLTASVEPKHDLGQVMFGNMQEFNHYIGEWPSFYNNFTLLEAQHPSFGGVSNARTVSFFT
jgi:hypothetical protein